MRHDVGAEFLTRAAGTLISEVSLLNGRVQVGGSVCPKIEKKASLVVMSCVRVTDCDSKADSSPEYRLATNRAVVRVCWGLDGCEVCLCDPCARVHPCVSRLPPVSFYRLTAAGRPYTKASIRTYKQLKLLA